MLNLVVKKGSRSSGKLGDPHELEGQENLLKELEFEKFEQTHLFHKCLLITIYVPGPQANNPPANKADNILCLLALAAIIINAIIIITIAMSWRKNWEGQAGKEKFQEATHNNLGDFLKCPTQVIGLPMKTRP